MCRSRLRLPVTLAEPPGSRGGLNPAAVTLLERQSCADTGRPRLHGLDLSRRQRR